MAARVWSSTYSSVHCHTFPTMSITPNGLAPFGCASTSLGGSIVRALSGVGAGASLPDAQPAAPPPRDESQSQFPQGKLRSSVPWAAYCHSHSWGSRFPAHFAYSRASSIDTQVTGLLAHPSGQERFFQSLRR